MAHRLGSFMPLLSSQEDGPVVRVFEKEDHKSLLVEFMASDSNSNQALAKCRALAWITHLYMVCVEDGAADQMTGWGHEDGVKIPADFLPALAAS